MGELVQHRGRPDSRTYVGKGKLEELKSAFADVQAEVLVVDDELALPQQRRLEDVLEGRVVDRTQLILDIFAQHAVTAEGKLQVELAQLEYNLPRMRGMWEAPRAPGRRRRNAWTGGEPTRESHRRLARQRNSPLKGRLKELSKQRDTRRKARVRSATPTIALAGYTNVGKSTLLNALTGAGVSVDNRLFETLDPDDPLVRARGPASPRDGHGRLHPPTASRARRRLRRDARGDARRRRRAPRGRCVDARGDARRDGRRR